MGICEWPQMPARMQSKKTFNLRKIVKKFGINSRKLDGSARELWRQLERKIEGNLKDGESELWNNLKSKLN